MLLSAYKKYDFNLCYISASRFYMTHVKNTVMYFSAVFGYFSDAFMVNKLIPFHLIR